MNAIGQREGQGRTFRFLNQQKEPYEWTDEVPEDDTEFQGLLENEEEAVYPDVSAELPGVELEAEERDFAPVSDEPEVDFRELAAAALHNAGIDTKEQLRAARELANDVPGDVDQLTVAEANKDEIVYKITFDLPDAGLLGEGKGSCNSRCLLAMIETIQQWPLLCLRMQMLLRYPRNVTQHDLAGVRSGINHMTSFPQGWPFSS